MKIRAIILFSIIGLALVGGVSLGRYLFPRAGTEKNSNISTVQPLWGLGKLHYTPMSNETLTSALPTLEIQRPDRGMVLIQQSTSTGGDTNLEIATQHPDWVLYPSTVNGVTGATYFQPQKDFPGELQSTHTLVRVQGMAYDIETRGLSLQDHFAVLAQISFK